MCKAQASGETVVLNQNQTISEVFKTRNQLKCSITLDQGVEETSSITSGMNCGHITNWPQKYQNFILRSKKYNQVQIFRYPDFKKFGDENSNADHVNWPRGTQSRPCFGRIFNTSTAKRLGKLWSLWSNQLVRLASPINEWDFVLQSQSSRLF